MLQAANPLPLAGQPWVAPSVPRGDLLATFVYRGYDEARCLAVGGLFLVGSWSVSLSARGNLLCRSCDEERQMQARLQCQLVRAQCYWRLLAAACIF
jgi:hypothetical protein